MMFDFLLEIDSLDYFYASRLACLLREGNYFIRFTDQKSECVEKGAFMRICSFI